MGAEMEKIGGIRLSGPGGVTEFVPFPQGEALAQALDQVADPEVRMNLYRLVEGRKVYDVEAPFEDFFVMGQEYYTGVIEDPPPSLKGWVRLVCGVFFVAFLSGGSIVIDERRSTIERVFGGLGVLMILPMLTLSCKNWNSSPPYGNPPSTFESESPSPDLSSEAHARTWLQHLGAAALALALGGLAVFGAAGGGLVPQGAGGLLLNPSGPKPSNIF